MVRYQLQKASNSTLLVYLINFHPIFDSFDSSSSDTYNCDLPGRRLLLLTAWFVDSKELVGWNKCHREGSWVQYWELLEQLHRLSCLDCAFPTISMAGHILKLSHRWLFAKWVLNSTPVLRRTVVYVEFVRSHTR